MRVHPLAWIAALALAGCPSRATRDASPDAAPAPSASLTVVDATAPPSEDAGVATSVEALVQIFEGHPEVKTLDDAPRHFPAPLLQSFVLKHGRDRTGERGHLTEKKISQSADPQAPRAILFDAQTGFVLTYNGGAPGQTNGQRLDVASFDPGTKSFAMWGIHFPLGAADAGKRAPLEKGDCTKCHGPKLRPIFSMYPDWPGFYGSDNDELTNAKVPVQVAELADLRAFRKDVAPKHPRYAPLFATPPREGIDPTAETFPYRPDVREDIHALSRAFAFRPGLRLGILLNRLTARMLVAHLERHERFDAFRVPLLAGLLQCRIEGDAMAAMKKNVEAALGEPVKLVSGVVHYRQLWKLFGLDVRDVDIRYGYGHEGYASDDASKNPMAVGYIGGYWNSYFDGSATIDELVAHGLYEREAKKTASLAGLVKPHGLVRKYQHLAERYRLDAPFFQAMDAQGLWIPIPYPKELDRAHHREGWSAEHKEQHERLCKALAAQIR